MPKEKLTYSESLQELEKLTKQIIRKSLKDNTLNYTVQITRSSVEPGKTKYAVHIDSPRLGVQPITFVHENYEVLKGVLEESITTINKRAIEIAFHEDRINMLENRLLAHKERKVILESGEGDLEEDDDIEMERV